MNQEELPLENEINELLELSKKGEEAERKFNELLEKLNQPVVVMRYTPLKPIYMDDIHDAINAGLELLQARGIIDLKDHGTRDIHESMVMILSDYFGDPSYRSHTEKTQKEEPNVNEREGI